MAVSTGRSSHSSPTLTKKPEQIVDYSLRTQMQTTKQNEPPTPTPTKKSKEERKTKKK